MSKRELIDAIRRHNHSVAPEFLAKFRESDLKAYLDRVCIITRDAVTRRSPEFQNHQELMVA